MTMHLVAFGATRPLAPPAFAALQPIPDPTITVAGNLLYVPDKYNQVIFAASLVKTGTQTQAQLQAPSLREVFFPDLTPLFVGANFSTTHPLHNLLDNPMQLATNEGLEFHTDSGDAAANTDAYGLVALSDGAITPAKGKIFTMRATSAVALAAQTWKNSALVFDQTLPVGNYDIVGMRASGAGLVASRLVFIGASAITRPGVPAQGSLNTADFYEARMGRLGMFGSFNSITPPSVDCLGDTGVAQIYEFDLIAR